MHSIFTTLLLRTIKKIQLSKQIANKNKEVLKKDEKNSI